MRITLAVLIAAIAATGCKKDEGKGKPKDQSASIPTAGSGSGSAHGRPKVKQIKPPYDTRTPPKDAIRTASGLVLKKITVIDAGPSPGKNDTVKVHYTGWKADGETMYSSEGRAQPMPMNLQQIPPGFAEALTQMKKGEKAMLWLPPEIGYRDNARPDKPEWMAYQVDLVDIIPSLPVPPDVGKPPEVPADKTPGGLPKLVLKPGAGEKARMFDNTTFNMTAWDPDGNQLQTTESGTPRPETSPPFHQPRGLEDILISLAAGERARFWVPPDQLALKATPETAGPITVEVELIKFDKQHAPPPVPADVAAPPADAKKTPKGVSYKVLKATRGKSPVEKDTVKVHYTGWTTDGRMFDSSVVRGTPSDFPVIGVIAGWTDGLLLMHAGERVRMWIPVELAYNNEPNRPAGMLVFDVELLEIKEAPKPPETPADVAEPPKTAKKTAKGVFYRVLKKGSGTASPKETDTVSVHYSGWTTDGKMFDSSVSRGRPAEFALNGVIAGWTDGLQVMKVGDKVRFWIPVELAYQNKPGRPQGMLVFDVELLEIKPPMAPPPPAGSGHPGRPPK